MSFLEPWNLQDKSEAPFVRGKSEDGYPSQNFSNITHTVQVKDARPNLRDFTLDRHGFTWHVGESLSPEILETIRSRDKQRVADDYYPLVEDIIRDVTGADRVVIFDHTYRKRDPALNMKENPNGREQPATVVRVHLV
jgi:hypothetical protein